MSFPEPASVHEPVLLAETIGFLNLQPGHVVVDGTLGGGGHAREILKRIGPGGRFIGIDQDPEALERARRNFEGFKQMEFINQNFSSLSEILQTLNLPQVDAVLLDVGISSDQLENAGRGFSFLKEGPLDMRMNPSRGESAGDLINHLPEEELARIFWEYGEERRSRRIARVITEMRQEKPFETTGDLSRAVIRATPRQFHFGARHPAMRVFQALRIAANGELEALKAVLPQALEALRPGGRLAVISFHSLEDRIVKHTFKTFTESGRAEILTRKPVKASEEETAKNPRARSAKLRVLEKIDKS